MADIPKIFVSYSWADRSEVDEIDNALSAVGLSIVKDRSSLKYKDSLKGFMKKVRQTDFVLVMISNDFLISPNCMYEVSELLKDDNYENKILPITIGKPKIYDANDIAYITNYWQKKTKELRKSIAKLDDEYKGVLIEQLRLFIDATRNISEFVMKIADMMHYSFEDVKRENYTPIIEATGFDENHVMKALLDIIAIPDREDKDIAIDDFILKYPQSPLGYFTKAQIENKKQNKKIELNNLNKAIKQDPAFASALNNRGNLFLEKGNFDQALMNFNSAIQSDPENAVVYYNRGALYKKINIINSALADLNKAITLDAECINALLIRGNVYQEIDEINKALDDYSRALEVDPDNYLCYYNRGMVYKKIGEVGKAQIDLTKTIQLKPKFAKAYYHLGLLYDKQKKWKKAITNFNKASKLEPERIELYTDRALVYLNLEEWDKALKDFNKALGFDNENSIALFFRGIIKNNELDDKVGAIQDWKRAADLDYEDAKKMLEKFEDS